MVIKPEQVFGTLEKGLTVYLTKSNVPNVCYLGFQVRQQRLLGNKHLFLGERVIQYVTIQMRTVRLVENME